MLGVLKPILEIQELDIQMIRLMRLKRQRNLELQQIRSLRNDLDEQYREKEAEIASLNEQISLFEQKIEDFIAKIKKLEQHQATVKKVDEFNTCLLYTSPSPRD